MKPRPASKAARKKPFKLYLGQLNSFIYPSGLKPPFSIGEVAIASFKGPFHRDNAEECYKCILFLHYERQERKYEKGS